MRVAVTGGTGYTGPAIVQEMLDEGHHVVVLEHRKALDLPDQPRLVRIPGDIREPTSLRRAFANCDAVAHLVAILREDKRRGVTFQKVHVEATRNVVDAARGAGIRRFLLMSANGVDSGLDTPYFVTKREMEKLVTSAGAFDWTIFRPSYIAGAREGGFDHTFAGIVDKSPLLPSFGGGKFEIQPVSRRNVGQAFARALSRPESVGNTYTLVGPERFTWREYLRRLARVRGRRRPLVWLPQWAPVAIATLAGKLFPATPDQLRMLYAGNVGDPARAVKDFDLVLDRWEDAVSGLARGGKD